MKRTRWIDRIVQSLFGKPAEQPLSTKENRRVDLGIPQASPRPSGTPISLPEPPKTVTRPLPAASGNDSSSSDKRIAWGESPPIQPPVPPRQISGQAPKLYTPQSTKKGITWDVGKGGTPDPSALVGIEDAFEHTPLQPGERIAFCTRDKVGFHQTTWTFLEEQNFGRCCVCGNADYIISLVLPGIAAGLSPVPTMRQSEWLYGEKGIALKQVHEHIGRAVVVQDYVYEVYRSKNTGTFFVRFERREPHDAPFNGFKVVIFPKYQTTWRETGIDPLDYKGHNVRVRGVIQNHPIWGLQILVNSPRVMQVVDELNSSLFKPS